MISFIVPAHNEEILLGAALKAIRRASSPLGEPFEILVVDDASTDRTAAESSFAQQCSWRTRTPSVAISGHGRADCSHGIAVPPDDR